MSARDPRLAEFERRLLACPTLPTLPAVALQILRLCREDEVDLWKIAAAVATDPALSARVLRAANSASVAARGRVSTLNRAVAILGSKAVLALTLSFALARGRRNDTADGVDRPAIWRRSAFSALAARTLAEVASLSVDPEEAFIAALLQDLGMLALGEVFRQSYGEVYAEAGGDHQRLVDLERAAWGADHGQASALLARTWHLPEPLQRGIAGSHGAPLPTDGPEVQQLATCVASSGPIAEAWTSPRGLDRLLTHAQGQLHLSPAVLEAVLARMALAVPEISADFDLDLGGPDHVEHVLREARALLQLRGLQPAPEPRPPVTQGPLDTRFATAFEYAVSRDEPIALIAASAPPAEGAALTAVLQGSLRSLDLLDRVGDGDALALLPSTDLAGAVAAAERLLREGRQVLQGPLYLGVAGSDAHGPRASLEALHAAAAGALATACARQASGVAVAPRPGLPS